MVCNHINTEQFAVCLLVVNNQKPFYQITKQAVEVVDLKKGRALFSLGVIKAAVKEFEPDIIFSTANHINLYLAIFKNSFRNGIKFIAREASVVSVNIQDAKWPFIYNRLVKKYYKRFDLIICQSAYMQQDLLEHYRVEHYKTVVLHNAIEENIQVPAAAQQLVSGQVFKFITVARLNKVKGIERLIHICGLLSIPFTYYIIGDGPQKKELQELINTLHLQDNVFLQGEKTDPFIGMDDADLYLMGSYYEGFPNVLLEAGSLGIPAIAFNVPGGIAEIIAEGENGFLIEDNDIIAYAAAINSCAFKNLNRANIIESTKKRFALENMINDLQHIFLKQTADK